MIWGSSLIPETMANETIAPYVAAYRKWRIAADAVDRASSTTPGREAKRQARIAKLKAKYESLLTAAVLAGEISA